MTINTTSTSTSTRDTAGGGGTHDHDIHHDVDESEFTDEPDREAAAATAATAATEELQLASRENSAVWVFRLVTFLVLLCVAIGVCVLIYIQGRQSEERDFEDNFAAIGDKVVTAFEETVRQRTETVANFAASLTSAVRENNDIEWPFYTPSDFEIRAGTTAKLTDLAQIFLLPMVAPDQKEEWEQYARDNQGWIAEGIAARTPGVEAQDLVGSVQEITPIMVTNSGEGIGPDQTKGPYFPIWTEYPASNFTFTNLNIYGNPTGEASIEACRESRRATFPSSYDFIGDTQEEMQESFVYLRIKGQEPDYDGSPYLASYYPVFRELKEDSDIAAVLLGYVIWYRYFENILPAGTEPLHVVLESQCDDLFTYEIEGGAARYVEHGDTHDPKYDYLQVSTSIEKVLGKVKFVEEVNCDYSIRVYPTKKFEESHYTNEPLHGALILAGVFLLTCAVFLLYDFMVERRQKVVMRSAQQSGKLVSTLFPEDVRKRLYEEEEAKKNKQKNNEDWKAASLTEAGTTDKHAIANLYPETTIFFADLAGFTKWSSSRTPAEVFDLLEALYGAIDAIAFKYKVFKVETIGDCYVAATGLPEPQPNHAVIMAKFARACLSKLHAMIGSLVESLGEDTGLLDMRIGLHSGPVTAGVLRGHKSRFQLYGDSVNTAARMESNGVKGKIHCSETTAIKLQEAGKSHWLTQREEKIVAKGKGEMQTYWVNVKGVSADTAETSVGAYSIRLSDTVADTVAGTVTATEPNKQLLSTNWLLARYHSLAFRECTCVPSINSNGRYTCTLKPFKSKVLLYVGLPLCRIRSVLG